MVTSIGKRIEKYTRKLNITLAFIGILMAVLLGFTVDSVLNLRQSDVDAEKLTLEAVQTDDGCEYSYVLPLRSFSGECVAFRTAHVEIEVYIGGEKVYSLRSPKSSLTRSTGYRWNFVMLNGDDGGKAMKIRVKNVYEGSTSYINEIYYGTEVAIFRTIAESNFFSFFLACIIFLTGIIAGIYAVCTAIKSGINSQIFSFSLFGIALGVWAITDSSITDLLMPLPMVDIALSHYSLMFMPITYVRYIKPLFSEKRAFAWDIYLGIDCIIIAFRTIVQLTEIWDLKQTLWMTHISIALFVLIGFVLGIRELMEKSVDKQLKVNIIFILITFVGTIAELVLFASYGACTIYGMTCFVVYVVVNTIQMIKRSQLIEKRAKEAEIYHNLAFTDGLTGIYNRMALMRDLSDEGMNKKTNALLMIDLNDLKKCNDGFGHEYGDKYIKTIATALNESFGEVGQCYRIGGDEFCVITHNVNSGEMDKLLSAFYEKLDSANREGFVVHIGAAVGCAYYDKTADKNLSDTMKRADEEMYKNKQMIKKRALAYN